MAPLPTDRDEALYQAIVHSPETFITSTELAKSVNIGPDYAQELLRKMERQGTVRRDRIHRTDYWSLNVDSTATPAPQKSTGLTPRHSPPGVKSASHSLHHRKR